MLKEGDKVVARQRIESRTAAGSLRLIRPGTPGVVLSILDFGDGPLNRAEIRFVVKGSNVDVSTFVGCVDKV